MSEVGWLIELKPSVVSAPAYWGIAADGELDWTPDHLAAIRYAREEDARKIIRYYGWTEAHPVEHQWG